MKFYFLKSFIKPLCFIHVFHVSMKCYCISGPVFTSSIFYHQNENNTDNMWNILSHLFIHFNNNFQVVLCLVSAHVCPSTLFKNQIKTAVCTLPCVDSLDQGVPGSKNTSVSSGGTAELKWNPSTREGRDVYWSFRTEPSPGILQEIRDTIHSLEL